MPELLDILAIALANSFSVAVASISNIFAKLSLACLASGEPEAPFSAPKILAANDFPNFVALSSAPTILLNPSTNLSKPLAARSCWEKELISFSDEVASSATAVDFAKIDSAFTCSRKDFLFISATVEFNFLTLSSAVVTVLLNSVTFSALLLK